MKPLLIAIIRAYQYCLSPWLGNQCRFYPSCSHYCLEAIETHGSIKGSYFGVLRILRCNPFFKGGYDPVPHQCDGNHSHNNH